MKADPEPGRSQNLDDTRASRQAWGVDHGCGGKGRRSTYLDMDGEEQGGC